ncbi:YadA C-terminal domain-containing protein [Morganella psychrotolerans]|uniref:Trimeric autotransporter adhesin YadA-like C-terminal membrane anchor domain-containing protein n=1 Tax=Morganella psychrotolerans TaxID=368603 RepID=A0A1B8H1L4_9GAMM|nr:YadA C-terminal domain-containing protein [Morganella psychrotolerans]OBU02960.1 hypothetical protein AYY17_11730 [Morganella psychrotolerans]
MKKNLLALIIAPLIVHATDAEHNGQRQNEKKITKVITTSLYYDNPVTFADKKTNGDRAVGISELDYIVNYLGRNIRDNNESIGIAQDDITKNQRLAISDNSKLDDKITSVSEMVDKNSHRIDAVMDDVRGSVIPDYVDAVLPQVVDEKFGEHITSVFEQKVLPLAQRTESLESKTQQLDTQLDITTRKSLHNNMLIGTIPGMIKDNVRDSLGDYDEYVIEPLKRQADHTEFAVQEVEKTIESAKVVTGVIMDATTRLEADVDALNTRVSNASKKANVTNNVATGNRKDIDQHTVKIEKNALDMLKNRQDLRGLENDLRETNERLDNGLAANAALNGLFQPYGIGKMNITAAMGGYNSTQAVAVGTGYRFNENIAMKTGVSYTDSNDVMYNMAVNLEW